MASHTLSSELYMKKILAGTSAGVLMAGGLLVATASEPAQADAYVRTLSTFCGLSAGSTSAAQNVVFKLHVRSNSANAWSPPMPAPIYPPTRGSHPTDDPRPPHSQTR